MSLCVGCYEQKRYTNSYFCGRTCLNQAKSGHGKCPRGKTTASQGQAQCAICPAAAFPGGPGCTREHSLAANTLGLSRR